MEPNEYKHIVEKAGGIWLSSFETLAEKLANIKAFIFDWDGVFNNGLKNPPSPSPFSEPDSMGTNLLRFGYWLKKRRMPVTAVISGASNATARYFVDREHFNCLYTGIPDKAQAFEDFVRRFNLDNNQTAFIFDDVIDLPVARRTCLNFFIPKPAAFLFRDYIVENQIADYLTANPAQAHAVREICELLLGFMGNAAEVFESREKFSSDYHEYLKIRNKIKPFFFKL